MELTTLLYLKKLFENPFFKDRFFLPIFSFNLFDEWKEKAPEHLLDIKFHVISCFLSLSKEMLENLVYNLRSQFSTNRVKKNKEKGS